MYKKQILLVILVFCILALSACNTSAAQPTPVFIPVLITVEIPVPITVIPSPTMTPLPTPTPSPLLMQSQNLEEDIQAWDVYYEGSPDWDLASVDEPSREGKSLKCSIIGGDPYSNAHCYLNLPSEPEANSFTLSLAFQFTPTTTCNNDGTDSIVQAIEFTMSKWYQSQRYEFAMQWQNVGLGAPQWRYWDPSKSIEEERWVPITSNVVYCLEGNQWHNLRMDGDIVEGQVHYRSFSIDNISYALDVTLPPVSTPGEEDRLAIAVQVDGNAFESPYDLFIDQVSFSRQSPPVIVDCRTIETAQLIQPLAEEIVKKETRILWSPTCPLVLQYYQNDDPIPIFEELADSGQYDLSMIPPGRTEIKIWISGKKEPAHTIFVTVR